MMPSMRSLMWATGLAALALPTAAAQDLVPKAGPQRDPVLIRDATVHTVSNGTLENASIEFIDGVITRVLTSEQGGRQLEIASGTMVIDGADFHVYPGFVAANTSLGLIEVDAVDMTLDLREAGSLKPEVRAVVAINPDSTLFPVARRNGVLVCASLPQGGLVSGRAAILRLDGWTWQDMSIVEDAGMVVSWPGGGRGRFRRRGGGGSSSPDRSMRILDGLIQQSKAYAAAREADPELPTDLRLEAMRPYVAGKKPLLVSANSLRQIEAAVQWCVERGLKLTILGGRDAALCCDLLIEHDVPVIVGGSHRLPPRRDLGVDHVYTAPGRLEQAGVRWCMSNPGEASNARNLVYEAAACVAYGLDPDVALRSITQSAADCLGIGERYGSLEVGKSATLFVTDGDAFELSTRFLAGFIDGRKVAMVDKQTALDEKYREKYRQLGILPQGGTKEGAPEEK